MLSCNDGIRRRIRYLAVGLLLFFGYLIVRLYLVQVRDHEKYYQEARKKYITSKTIKGSRGEIFDFHGNLLVGNMPRQDVSITPCNIKPSEDKKLAQILSRELNLDYHKVLSKVSRKSRVEKNPDGTEHTIQIKYAAITSKISLETARHLRNTLKKHKLSRHVHFEDVQERYYPKGQLLSNALGLTQVTDGKIVPTMGVEKQFNQALSSDSGKRTFMRSLDGWQMGDKPINEKDSHDGQDLYLTIVEPIQAILEDELDKVVKKWQPLAAYAIMVDPVTGNVLGIAERPSFDPNNRKTLTGSAFRMRAINDYYEPGSIMKPVTVAGALDYHIVTPSTQIDCEKAIWFFRGSRLTDTHAYGLQDVTGVIRKSSNIGTAKIAVMMGEQRLYRTFRRFGFGAKSGLQLTPESSGKLHPLKRWDGLSISRFCIGYGIGCTPVQMVRAYCALANRGKLPQLRLLDRMVNTDTGKVTRYPTPPPVNIYSDPATGEAIVRMMVTVTEKGGTATRAAIPGYHVAGKTGTSHKNIGRQYVNKYYASFVGFVPAEKPAFVLLITVDEPKGGKFGGTVAAPAWKAIAERTLKYMNIPPNVPLEDKKTLRN